MTTPGRTPRWDEQLQRRLARGEETALAELYDQLAPLVHGLAGRILADQTAAEQLTREVFAHLWEHPEAFDPEQGSLRSWLGALTHRRAVDRLRLARGPLQGVYRDAADDAIRTPATAARVQYVVDSLPDSLRETIAVTYYDGRTYQETADRLGISEQAAKQRMRLGLELLATELAEAEAPTDTEPRLGAEAGTRSEAGSAAEAGTERGIGGGGP